MIHLNRKEIFDESIDELICSDKKNFSAFLSATLPFQREWY